jgi:hypothetical protein
MNNIVAVLAFLGIGFFCGIVPLGFALILYFTQRKRGQVGSAVNQARPVEILDVTPGSGLVRLQGRIIAPPNALDGPEDAPLVYLRFKVEIYKSDDDSSGWVGFTEKAHGVPFQLEDGSGTVWVNPEGLDKQLLGEGSVPNNDQITRACLLLGISTDMLRGQLRYRIWELRAGQTITVVGAPVQGQSGVEVVHSQGQPFVISPMLGVAVDSAITSQKGKARTWMLIIGIFGGVFLLCGLGGFLYNLIRALSGQ